MILSIFSFSDLAAIRKLLESEGQEEVCPSCDMPFDKGKKRKLIDACGHERCYSCMFKNERCPLCEPTGARTGHDELQPLKKTVAMAEEEPPLREGVQQRVSRSQVKTNGHFTTYMQVGSCEYFCNESKR